MSDINEVVRLLEEWRDSSGISRLRVGVDAARTIGALSAEGKRALAIEVASRVAPQLVPAIESEEGDLTSEQVTAVIDLLRRADRSQLDDLVTAVRTGNVPEALTLVDDALDAVGPAAATTAGRPVAAGRRVVAAEGQLDELAGDAVRVLDADELDAAAVDPGLAGELDEAAEQLEELGVDLDAERERLEAEARARAERWKDTSRTITEGPAYRAPDLSFSIELTDDELPDPEVEEVAPLEERRAALPGAGATATSDARGPAAAPSSRRTLTAAPTPMVVAAITATPDGFRRRRATLAAIRDGHLTAPDVVEVIRSLTRGTDRVWVAGAALDAGLIGADSLGDLDLTDAAARRLARRVP